MNLSVTNVRGLGVCLVTNVRGLWDCLVTNVRKLGVCLVTNVRKPLVVRYDPNANEVSP